MDVSKQGVQSVFVHFINIALSIFFSSLSLTLTEGTRGDECAFYFISFILDTALGIHLIWLFLRAVRVVSKMVGVTSIQYQGQYGSPPSFEIYVKQLYVFLAATALSKLVLALVMFAFHESLNALGTWLFQSLQLRPASELIVVMLLAPLFLNAAQYWVQDSILSSPSTMRHEYSDLDLHWSKHDDGGGGAGAELLGAGAISGSGSPGRGGPDRVFFRVRANS